MAWYKEWFGAEYLELYAHRDEGEALEHVDFVVRTFGTDQRAVLDLACGAGRHTAALRERGLRTLGVDLSVTLLAHPPHVPVTAGDMRCLPLADDSFDLVLNFFTSFGYFERERENFRVLEEIVRILRPGGRFLIDLFNRDQVIAALKARETQEIAGRRVEIERWYDADSRRINKRICLKDGGSTQSYLESVRAYSRDEVTIGLRWAGLEVETVYGNFRGDSHDAGSERLIIVGRKPI